MVGRCVSSITDTSFGIVQTLTSSEDRIVMDIWGRLKEKSDDDCWSTRNQTGKKFNRAEFIIHKRACFDACSLVLRSCSVEPVKLRKTWLRLKSVYQYCWNSRWIVCAFLNQSVRYVCILHAEHLKSYFANQWTFWDRFADTLECLIDSALGGRPWSRVFRWDDLAPMQWRTTRSAMQWRATWSATSAVVATWSLLLSVVYRDHVSFGGLPGPFWF